MEEKEKSKWHTVLAGLNQPAVRRAAFAVLGVLLGLVTEQVADLDVLPPQAVVALRMLGAALSGS